MNAKDFARIIAKENPDKEIFKGEHILELFGEIDRLKKHKDYMYQLACRAEFDETDWKEFERTYQAFWYAFRKNSVTKGGIKMEKQTHLNAVGEITEMINASKEANNDVPAV